MHFTQLTITLIIILFLTGLIAGFIDSVAGGGGLITLPVLLSIGISPVLALGTNKMQSSMGTLSASFNFIRKGKVDLKSLKLGILCTFIGAASGSILVQVLESDFLVKIIPILLIIIFLYTLFSKKISDKEVKPRISERLYFVVFGLLIGCYDGFFGPGTGSFWVASCIFFIGAGMIRATGITKIMNFTSNVVSLIFFIIGGNVLFKVGIIMGVGQLIGAKIGSSLAIKNGTKFIRPLFLTMVFLTIVKLVYQTYY